MEAAQVDRAGLNLKPSGRVPDEPGPLDAPIEPGKTVGNIEVADPIFSCRDVDVYYGEKHAIKKVGIDIARNQVLAMIGPSGCGKSTFLRCLNRMPLSAYYCGTGPRANALLLGFGSVPPPAIRAAVTRLAQVVDDIYKEHQG